MKLSDTAVRKAKPEAKSYKMADGGGMYLEVMPTGSKYWRLKYRFGGKEKRLAFGVYPDVSLAQARETIQQRSTSAWREYSSSYGLDIRHTLRGYPFTGGQLHSYGLFNRFH